MRRKPVFFMFMLCMVVVLCCSCDRLFPTRIGDIAKDPRAFADKDVTVSGEVGEAISLYFVKYFSLNDGTGEIIVVSSKPLPRKGEKLRIKGRIREAFSLGDKTLLVIVENEETKK